MCAEETKSTPLISVLIASYNSEIYIADAIRSLLCQTMPDFEVIIIDDASTDSSRDIIDDFTAKDNRIKYKLLSQNSGPSVARNVALDMARGRWIAIMDSDDLLHPRRFEYLMAEAEKISAELIADDLIVFDDAMKTAVTNLFSVIKPFNVNTTEFILNEEIDYGYLKPLIKRSFLEKHNLQYKPELRNSEDFDLILRILLKGATYTVLPFPGYFYRKHDESISFYRSAEQLQRILDANREISKELSSTDNPVKPALDKHYCLILKELEFGLLVEAIKKQRILAMLKLAITRPHTTIKLLRLGYRKITLKLVNTKTPSSPSVIFISSKPLDSMLSDLRYLKLKDYDIDYYTVDEQPDAYMSTKSIIELVNHFTGCPKLIISLDKASYYSLNYLLNRNCKYRYLIELDSKYDSLQDIRINKEIRFVNVDNLNSELHSWH